MPLLDDTVLCVCVREKKREKDRVTYEAPLRTLHPLLTNFLTTASLLISCPGYTAGQLVRLQGGKEVLLTLLQTQEHSEERIPLNTPT